MRSHRQTTQLGPRFEQALVYAAQVHALQERKDSGVPYVAHLLGVASLVLEDHGDEDEAIGALLHDAAEDQGGRKRLEDIRARFGDRVVAIVTGCTDFVDEPKPPWRERKERYLEHLPFAMPSVLLVSVADKVHNARAILADYRQIGDALWCQFSGGTEVLWYYGALVQAHCAAVAQGRHPSPTRVAELERVVSDLEYEVRRRDGSAPNATHPPG
jgi:(p)ppGpp synthase/HD superfamily hydrolase